jgi:hypothetical protein
MAQVILPVINTTSLTWLFNSPTNASASVNTVNSVTVGSTGVQLVNDSAAPGNNTYYGTDSGGVLGYHNLGTSMGGGSVTQVALTMPVGFFVSGSPINISGTLAVTTNMAGIIQANGSNFGTVIVGTGLNYSTTTHTLTAPGSGGTVTSVNLTMPFGFSVSGTPITTSGTMAVTSTLNGSIVYADSGNFGTVVIGSGLNYSTTTHTLAVNPFGGAVTSVGLAGPPGFSISGSPVTSTGTLGFNTITVPVTSSADGNWWVEASGTSPSRTISLMVNDSGTVWTLASIVI